VNCRFIKPFDEKMLSRLARDFRCLITLEENVLGGGFGQQVLDWLNRHNLRNEFHCLGLEDGFVEQGSRRELLQQEGLSAQRIEQFVLQLDRSSHFRRKATATRKASAS